MIPYQPLPATGAKPGSVPASANIRPSWCRTAKKVADPSCTRRPSPDTGATSNPRRHWAAARRCPPIAMKPGSTTSTISSTSTFPGCCLRTLMRCPRMSYGLPCFMRASAELGKLSTSNDSLEMFCKIAVRRLCKLTNKVNVFTQIVPRYGMPLWLWLTVSRTPRTMGYVATLFCKAIQL